MRYLFLLLSFSLCGAVTAQMSAKDYKMICPVDGTSVTGWVYKAPKSGEQDRDLYRHYSGVDHYGKSITLCPECGYAVYTPRFESPVADAAKAAIIAELGPTTKSRLASLKKRYKALNVDLAQDAIPGLFKFQNAMRTYDILELDKVVRGKLALEASWFCRQLLLNPPVLTLTNESMVRMNNTVNRLVERRTVEGTHEWMGIYRQALAKSSSRVKYCIYVVLAGLSDRIGDVAGARKYLDAAESLAWEPQLKNLMQYNQRVLKTAAMYRSKAIGYFIEALSEKRVRSSETALLTYLCGELLRRNGEGARAKYWLKAVKQIPGASKTMIAWAKEQYALIDANTAPNAADRKAVELVLAGQENSDVVSAGLDRAKLRMKLLRAAILLFKVETGLWPENLTSLVTLGYIKDTKETLCPITQEPYVYLKPHKMGFVEGEVGEKSPPMLSTGKLYPVLYGVRSHKILLNGEFVAE